MTIWKVVFIFILFASLTCSGCITISWNRKTDSKISPRLSTKTFSHERDAFGVDDNGKYPEYKKCDYIGKETIEGFNYHRYLCPNMFSDSENAFLELFIPSDTNGNKKPIIKSVNRQVLPVKRTNLRDSVYVQFTTNGAAILDPNFIRVAVDRSSDAVPFTANYPSLISMNIYQMSGRPTLAFGQRMDKGLYTSDDLVALISKGGDHYSFACQKGLDKSFISKEDYSRLVNRVDCDVWYWSRQYVSGHIETTDKTLWKIARGMGYLITVPADIITSPLQLVAFGIMSANWPH